MARLDAFGDPAYLVVPSALHRMDVKPWKDRYPKTRVVAPAGARSKVEEIVRVDATHVDFGDEKVRLMTVPGTSNREAAMIVERDSGTTLVLNDLLFNLGHRSGLRGDRPAEVLTSRLTSGERMERPPHARPVT